jgi:alpha-amylase
MHFRTDAVSQHHHRRSRLCRRARSVAAGAVALFATIAFQTPRPADAGVLMQGFYWDVPSPAAGSSAAPWWWDNLAARANEMRLAGITAVWIPSPLKGASGGYSMGYDPYDDYDLGSKNQMYTLPTRFGTREQLQRSVATMRANGLDVYVDMVLNHRNGDPGNFSFLHPDAYGNWGQGRFQKGTYDFHPNVPQDPNVPNEDSSFGRDVAHVNGAGGYVGDGLKAAGDWLTKALDVQGYRLDYVKGISSSYLVGYLNSGAMAGKFTVGEFWDGNRDTLNWWVQTAMQNRSSAFDFSLREELKSMCNGGGFYDMRRLDHAGLTGINPSGSVTFVENHDTDKDYPITQKKLLAYAYTLTSEGYPTVFYRDWSTDPGCYGLKTKINNLVWVHEKLAAGATQERWKDGDVFAYERLGGSRLLVGLNDNGASARTVTVQTGFGANVQLNDFTGHMPDVWTDGSGRATITIPANAGAGTGYVCYSRENAASGGFTAPQYAVTQEFAGANDLDIKPADNMQLVTVGRVYAQAGKPITGALYYNTAAWTGSTRVYLELLGTTNTVVTSRSYYSTTAQGTALTTTPSRTGWYTFRVRSYDTPAANARPAYWLRATYTAPQL